MICYHYRDAWGQTWDLAVRVPERFDPTAYEWGARPSMAGFGPGRACCGPSASVGNSLPSCLQGNSGPRLGWVPACILVLRPTIAQDPKPLARCGPGGAGGYH